MTEADLKTKFKKVEAAWAAAYKMQEEKVQLATQTYEMVIWSVFSCDMTPVLMSEIWPQFGQVPSPVGQFSQFVNLTFV